MSRIFSKIGDLNELRFEPLTAAVVKVRKMTMIDQTIVALGEDGVIYTTGVRARLGYTDGHEGRLSRVLDGCVKLRVLSADAVRKHKEVCKARADAQHAKYLAKSIAETAAELGLNLTAAQKAKLAKLTPNAEIKGLAGSFASPA